MITLLEFRFPNKEMSGTIKRQENKESEGVCKGGEPVQELKSNWRTRAQWNVGERNYKFAVANNTVVDKPHHFTLQKQKEEMVWDSWGSVGPCVCACVWRG